MGKRREAQAAHTDMKAIHSELPGATTRARTARRDLVAVMAEEVIGCYQTGVNDIV